MVVGLVAFSVAFGVCLSVSGFLGVREVFWSAYTHGGKYRSVFSVVGIYLGTRRICNDTGRDVLPPTFVTSPVPLCDSVFLLCSPFPVAWVVFDIRRGARSCT